EGGIRRCGKSQGPVAVTTDHAAERLEFHAGAPRMPRLGLVHGGVQRALLHPAADHRRASATARLEAGVRNDIRRVRNGGKPKRDYCCCHAEPEADLGTLALHRSTSFGRPRWSALVHRWSPCLADRWVWWLREGSAGAVCAWYVGGVSASLRAAAFAVVLA